MKPDVLVTWPAHCDYPLWRRWLAGERERFAKVIVAFSPTPGLQDLREHVRSVTPDVTFLDTRWEDGWDWRDAAVNAALDASSAEWVWFTEQDFLVQSPRFWPFVESFEHCREAIGTRQGQERWHPCCLFVRRDWIDRTGRYFGSDPVDHFCAFGRELEELGARIEDIDDWIARTPSVHYTHMAGLSHNHSLVERGEPVTYRPDEFARYLLACINVPDMTLAPQWIDQATTWLSWYAEHGGREDS